MAIRDRTFTCDGPDCKTWVATALPRPNAFIVVQDAGPKLLYFCTWDCVMKYAAEMEPTETIS